ncbi:tyrosinase-like [Branchiostoma floridae x Branchiostoma japonicum]
MKAIALLIVLAECFRRGDSQFPRVCTSDAALYRKECCPVPPGFTEPCGGTGRGHCADIPDPVVEDVRWKDAYHVDVFFNRTCLCEGNFSGYDCTSCSWGYRGPSCETKQQPTVRRNIRDISTKERAKFRRYMDRVKNAVSDFVFALEFKENIRGSQDFVNVSVYDYFVTVHYYASRETLPPSSTGICVEEKDCSLDFAHEGAGFPTWHRAFLPEAEQALQEVNGDPDWTMPYWDWSAAEQHQCDICTNEYVGANDEDGNLGTESIFAAWPWFITTADSAQPERGAPPGHNHHEYMVPFFPPYSHADMFKPSTELGYDYQELHGQGKHKGSDMGECSAAWPGRLEFWASVGLLLFFVVVCLLTTARSRLTSPKTRGPVQPALSQPLLEDVR